MFKRLIDLIISGTVLFLFWPLFVAIAVLIKLETPGPVFYLQRRVGIHGKIFRMFKFRKFPRDTRGGPGVTLVNDCRMTKMGKRLERFKLDELPQFINVLLGDMSVVGPRPETPAFANHYSEADKRVLGARPGIFGVNQLIYRREAALFPPDRDPEDFYIKELMPKKLQNDIVYLEQRTTFKDMKILARCIWRVVAEPVHSKLAYLGIVRPRKASRAKDERALGLRA